jgi:hypothetical protein
LAEVSIPLGDFVFKDAMIAKRVPCQTTDLAMVLMRVIPTMREDDIGIGASL